MALFSRHLQRDISGVRSGGGAVHSGSWLSAAVFSVGTSLLTLALSCVTDMHCRRGFLRQERVRRQQQQAEEHEEELKKSTGQQLQ